jgi:hypothetical protein
MRTNSQGIELLVRGTATVAAIGRLRHDEFSSKRQRNIGWPEVEGTCIETDDDRIDDERPARVVHDPDSTSV